MLLILSHSVRLTLGIVRLRKAQSALLSQTIKAILGISWTMPEELEGNISLSQASSVLIPTIAGRCLPAYVMLPEAARSRSAPK